MGFHNWKEEKRRQRVCVPPSIFMFCCVFVHVCVLDCPLKYRADSNQIPVNVSSQQTDQWRSLVRSTDPGSLAVHPPWIWEVSDMGWGTRTSKVRLKVKMKACVSSSSQYLFLDHSSALSFKLWQSLMIPKVYGFLLFCQTDTSAKHFLVITHNNVCSYRHPCQTESKCE